MKRILIAMGCLTVLSLPAATPPHGNERLRELVVLPEMNLTFNFGMSLRSGEWEVSYNTSPEVEIPRLREALKQQPDNVEQLLQLANLLDGRGETNESRAFYRIAEQLCRKQTAARPQDGLALTELGKTLWQMDKDEEAGSIYRRAVLVSSNEWRCWTGLGNFLSSEFFAPMFPPNLRRQIMPSTQAPSPELLNYRPAPEALEKAETSLDEASRCFDRAMALAPKEADVFFQRAGYLSISNWQSCFFRHYRDNSGMDSSRLTSAFFSTETVASLQKAAALDPRNYKLTCMAAYFGWFNGMMQAGWPTNDALEKLPRDTQRAIQMAMKSLEDLSENSDKKTAAAALEGHGILNMAFDNKRAAAADFRRAVALDPSRESAWDMLLGTMVDSASPDEITAFCETRLRQEGSARNHLLLAKALTKQEKWNAAAGQAEIAGKLETNNVVPPLLMAAIALKQGSQTNYLATAKTNLNLVNALLRQTPDSDEKHKRWREFMLNGSILTALDGEPGAAKNWAKEVLKNFPADETATEILKVLDASAAGGPDN